jgi:hypothetical protein
MSMRTKFRSLLLVTLPIASALIASTDGCISNEPSHLTCPDDPKDPLYDEPICVMVRAYLEGGDGDAFDAADVSTKPSCPGTCVPHEPIDWDPPAPLWIGKAEDAPETCVPYVGAFGSRRFADLVSPPAECDACTCEAQGTCTGAPGKISVRAGTCDQEGATAIDASDPAGWDGSCTTTNAIPADAKCNGVPCAQSIAASAMPGPSDETCVGSGGIPSATLPATRWATVALSCAASAPAEDSTCVAPSLACTNKLPAGWRHCIYRRGIHDCPAESAYTDARFVVYDENAVKEGRSCSACSCGAPVGGACVGQLRMYADGACSQLVEQGPVSSLDGGCSNMTVPGAAVGSKEIAGLGYVPGTCAATGGEPKGKATPDPEGAATWCCLKPEKVVE